jgi:hypothetical protein
MLLAAEVSIFTISEEVAYTSAPRLPRCFVAWVVCSCFGIVLAQGLTALLSVAIEEAAGIALRVSLAPPLFSLLLLLLDVDGRRKGRCGRAGRWLTAIGFLALGCLGYFGILAAAAAGALAVILILLCLTQPLVLHRLPREFDEALARRPWLAILWTLIALLSVFQSMGLSTFMADHDAAWGSAVPAVEEIVNHQCLSAYLYAAELDRRGEANIYDPGHYPTTSSVEDLTVLSEVEGLARFVDDPFLYPPTFLLLPRLALDLSDSFELIRTGIFAINALLCMGTMLAFACWIGGRRGRMTGLLLPLAWCMLPVLIDLQYGQFHLFAVMLGAGGMLALERKRPALGGLLLALAITNKIFPGLLLIPLLVARRWRDLAWVVAYGLLLLGIAWVWIGEQAFAAFFGEHLPRLANGDAFAFFEEDSGLIALNASPYGFIYKLQSFGLEWANRSLALLALNSYTVVIVLLAVFLGLRPPQSRADKALAWAGLLGLAALRSPFAPSLYVLAGFVWLLTLTTTEQPRRLMPAVGIVLVWPLASNIPFLPFDKLLVLPQVVFIGLCLWALGLHRSDRKIERVAIGPVRP